MLLCEPEGRFSSEQNNTLSDIKEKVILPKKKKKIKTVTAVQGMEENVYDAKLQKA